jgi:hypothetical protein
MIVVTIGDAKACAASHERCIWQLASLHCGPFERWVARG